MNRITQYFLKHTTLFWSLLVCMTLLGVYAFIVMPKLEDPDVRVKQAAVAVMWPGADAHTMELEVAQAMEEQLRTVVDVTEVKTDCSSSLAIFTVEFKMRVSRKDLEQHFDMLRRKVEEAANYLPQGCYPPLVIDDRQDVYGIFYALTGEDYSNVELSRYAKYIKRELYEVKGVKRINLIGERSECVNITLPVENVTTNGLIPIQIIAALQGVGTAVDAGQYDNGDYRVPFRVPAATVAPEEVGNLLLSSIDGKQFRLSDVATVERAYSEPQTDGFFVDNRSAIGICIAMEPDAIVPNVGRAVQKKLDEIVKTLPEGIDISTVFSQPAKVSSAIGSFMLNLLVSVLIVVGILILVMGIKSGLIIGAGLALTICCSFPIMLLCGTTLHRVSLGAFIVAMGMLVDNAIVIMDGIKRDRNKGLPESEYLVRTVKNTALPLLGATVIAASAFICVYLSPDTTGEYAGDLFVVLSISLLVSWVLALVQVPFFARLFFKPLPEAEISVLREDGFLSGMRRGLTGILNHKAITLSVAVLLLVGCALGIRKVKMIFLPDFSYGQFVVECFMPPQTTPDKVKAELTDMTDLLLENPEIKHVYMSQGSTPAHYCLARPMTLGGGHYGELIVDGKDYKSIVKLIPEVRKQLRENYPDTYIRIRKYNFSITTSHTIEVEFMGPDPAVLKRLAAQTAAVMRQSDYVDPYSIQTDWAPYAKNYTVEYLPEKGAKAGVSRSDVANSIAAAREGMTVGVLRDGDKILLAKLRVRHADGTPLEDLSTIPVWSMLNFHFHLADFKSVLSQGGGFGSINEKVFRSIPLAGVVKGITPEREEGLIKRFNGRRAIQVEADPNPDNPTATPAKAVALVKKALKNREIPEGYSVMFNGDAHVLDEGFNNIMRYVPITLLIIIVTLLLLFESWKKSVMIFLCFPFVALGIIPALLITGFPFNFMAIIGVVGLLGMMVKNAIVLIDEINRLEKEGGVPPYRAVIDAAVNRTYPVLMASATTIVGMIPLLTDPMYETMAITLMSGLAMGTVVVLFLIPLFYTLFFRIRKSEIV